MKPTEKLDLYKLNKQAYASPRKPIALDITRASYLSITGQGAPGGEGFSAAIGALYAVAFTIKMSRKFAGQQDYTVCKLEGQWWSDAVPDFSNAPKEDWKWRLLIRTPEFITRKELAKAVAVLLKRGKPREIQEVGLESMHEGLCVQMLHVGPYEKEHETIALMDAFAESRQLQLHGLHHEIYLSDPRRVRPEQLKTILRRPARRRRP